MTFVMPMMTFNLNSDSGKNEIILVDLMRLKVTYTVDQRKLCETSTDLGVTLGQLNI